MDKTAFLKGEQIFLRAASVDDASENYLSWINDPETTRGLVAGLFPSTLQDLRQYLQQIESSKDSVMFAICDNNTNQHIGNVKLDRFDWVSGTCELGILIGEQTFWGKGIATEVCRLVLDYAFDRLNLRKVLLAVYANNPGAIAVYKKIGFQLEGTLRKHVFQEGEHVDKHFMGIFSNERQ